MSRTDELASWDKEMWLAAESDGNIDGLWDYVSSLRRQAAVEATPQDTMLDLIDAWKFNAFDGRRVANDLRRHRALWDSILMLSEPGLMLRDLAGPRPIWHADKLWILTKIDRMEPLKRVVSEWRADCLRWTTEDGEWSLEEDSETGKFKTKRVDKKARATDFVWDSSNESAVVFFLWWD